MSRRGFLSGLVAFGSGAAAMGVMPGTAKAMETSRFAFTPIDIQTDGTVHVPQGYKWETLVRWGDPLFSDAAEFDNTVGGAPEDAARVFGENTDGMESFMIGDAQVIAVNHEYTNRKVNLPHASEDGVPTRVEDVVKLQNLQGVAVMEVAQGESGWEVVVDSPLNRRITHLTPMQIAGPAAGHDLLKTKADPTGTQSLGTFNNCGSGKTPWGTYLTCEENFNGYFGSTEVTEDKKPIQLNAGYARYGIGGDGWGLSYDFPWVSCEV